MTMLNNVILTFLWKTFFFVSIFSLRAPYLLNKVRNIVIAPCVPVYDSKQFTFNKFKCWRIIIVYFFIYFFFARIG